MKIFQKVMVLFFLVFFVLASAVVARNSSFGGTDVYSHYENCTFNVSAVSISSGAYPGSLVLTNDKAFSIVAGGVVVVGAAGVLDNGNGGRVAGFAHSSFLSATSLTEANGLGRLIRNVVQWVGRSTSPLVALQSGVSRLSDMATAQLSDFVVGSVTDSDILSGVLSNYDVLIAEAAEYESPELKRLLREYLEAGGGLIFYGTSWAYDYPNGFDDELVYPANYIMHGTGVTFVGVFDWGLDRTQPWIVPAILPDPILLNAGSAASAYLLHVQGQIVLDASNETLVTDTILATAESLMDNYVNFSFFDIVNEISDAILSKEGVEYPSIDYPIENVGEAEFLFAVDSMKALDLPVEELIAHPSVHLFPGSVPNTSTPVKKTVIIYDNFGGFSSKLLYSNAGRDRWQSLGLYLEAGSVVTIELPETAVQAGLGVQVGCHTDSLYNKEELSRMPKISRWWPLKKTVNKVSSSFGGLLYITTPINTESPMDHMITVLGAHETLLYVHGVTTQSEWLDKVSVAQAGVDGGNLPPFGELVSNNVVLSLPTKDIVLLKDPFPVMDYWDEVMKQEDLLLGYPLVRQGSTGRAERFVTDAQISNGWMHSGYPIMAYVEASYEQIDIEHLLTNGEWGPWHEYGHNHQWRDFMVPMTTEVSVNWFSTFVQQSVNKNGDLFPRDGICVQTIRNYLASPNYADLADPWLHLSFFLPMKQAFGWNWMQSVMQDYVSGADGVDYDAMSEAERIDPLLIKFSRAAGVSFIPWFEAWDYPVAEDTLMSLADLPDWDYALYLGHMEEQDHPTGECYTPPDAAYTAVHFNDPLLLPTLYKYSQYRGVVNVTENGYVCQPWDSQTPNTHDFGPEDEPCEGLSGEGNNYCRMNGENRPWCYTIDGPRWEFCNVELCPNPNTTTSTPFRPCSMGKLKKNQIKQETKNPAKYESCPSVLAYDLSCLPITSDSHEVVMKKGGLKIHLGVGSFTLKHKKGGYFNEVDRYGEFLMDSCITEGDKALDIFVTRRQSQQTGENAHVFVVERNKKGKVRDNFEVRELIESGVVTCGGQSFDLGPFGSLTCITGVSSKN